MAKVWERTENGERFVSFHCPGCEYGHQVRVAGKDAWEWNGSSEKPTIKPSIFVNKGSANPGVPACHSVVTDGKINFLADCSHALAGKVVDLPDWEDS
jgi:hypothetical protein